MEVILIETSDHVGGRVRSYGCKSVEKCLNCGVCLSTNLWQKVANCKNIQLLLNSNIAEVTGVAGDFSVYIINGNERQQHTGIDSIVVCTGFDNQQHTPSSHLHIDGSTGIMTGTQLDKLLLSRTRDTLFEHPPSSVAFIQCVGSRDKNENGSYCSRVCCSYATRAARVIRSFYPDCEIVFFYMELQNVEVGDYYAALRALDMEFINCRPLKIAGGTPVTVEYETGLHREFDLVVLSDGIRAGADNDRLAEVCKLNQDEYGFLRSITTDSGIYVAGCAKSPMSIAEAHTDALNVARTICNKAVEGNGSVL